MNWIYRIFLYYLTFWEHILMHFRHFFFCAWLRVYTIFNSFLTHLIHKIGHDFMIHDRRGHVFVILVLKTTAYFVRTPFRPKKIANWPEIFKFFEIIRYNSVVVFCVCPAAVVIAFFLCWAPFHAQRLLYLYAKESPYYPQVMRGKYQTPGISGNYKKLYYLDLKSIHV